MGERGRGWERGRKGGERGGVGKRRKGRVEWREKEGLCRIGRRLVMVCVEGSIT